MTLPSARLGDLHQCTIPPGFPSPIQGPSAPTVQVGKIPASVVGDLVMSGPVPAVPPLPPFPHPLVRGSVTVMICKRPAVRVTDLCSCGGIVVLGCMTVLIGG